MTNALKRKSEPKLPSAIPIETSVWCSDCGEPHELFDDHIAVWDRETCPTITEKYGKPVDKLPENWDREYVAEYGSRVDEVESAYLLIPKHVEPIKGVHHPMYYLETSE